MDHRLRVTHEELPIDIDAVFGVNVAEESDIGGSGDLATGKTDVTLEIGSAGHCECRVWRGGIYAYFGAVCDQYAGVDY